MKRSRVRKTTRTDMTPASAGALATTPATETPVSPSTDAGISTVPQIIDDDEQFTRSTAPTNLYADEDWRRIKDALAAYEQIEKDLPRHRHDWLHVIGPTLVMVRAKAFEVSGTTNVKSPHYQDAIREELKRTGLDVIHKTTRSYLLKIMDNLSDVEAWLAERPNPERLNHPKTIWKAFFSGRGEWEDD